MFFQYFSICEVKIRNYLRLKQVKDNISKKIEFIRLNYASL
jgi:hypothetical protein